MSYRGPPMTLGNAAAAKARLILRCRDCQYQIEPDPAEMAAYYDAGLAGPDWAARLAAAS